MYIYIVHRGFGHITCAFLRRINFFSSSCLLFSAALWARSALRLQRSQYVQYTCTWISISGEVESTTCMHVFTSSSAQSLVFSSLPDLSFSVLPPLSCVASVPSVYVDEPFVHTHTHKYKISNDCGTCIHMYNVHVHVRAHTCLVYVTTCTMCMQLYTKRSEFKCIETNTTYWRQSFECCLMLTCTCTCICTYMYTYIMHYVYEMYMYTVSEYHSSFSFVYLLGRISG